MFRISLGFLVFSAVISPVCADSPDPKSLLVPVTELDKSRALVQQLGREEFTEREEAEQALAKMGRLAWLALLEGVNTDPNPEVRTRCAALLPRANALEMKARLEVFLADAEGKYDHDLPGWNQFRATISNEWNLFGHAITPDRSLEKAARAVFVELISTPVNKCVVMAVGATPGELNSMVIARRMELYNQRSPRQGPGMGGGFTVAAGPRKEPTPEDIAALMFAESFSSQSTARIPRQISIGNLMSTSGFSSLVRDTDEKGRVYKAIAKSWLESRINPVDLYQGMSLASQLGLTDQAVRMAARLLVTPGTPANYRGTAATTFSRLGTREHIPLLEKAFEDTGVLTLARGNFAGNFGNGVANREVQIRDVALAIAIQLSGQVPEDYGFIDQYKDNGGPPGLGYSYTRYSIPNEKRTAAFEQWKQWWAKNKDM